jgi:hypothetical protein
MNVGQILKEIDAEISKLQSVRTILLSVPGGEPKARRGRPPKPDAVEASTSKRGRLSPESIERIRQAQLKRWAKTKKA